MRTDYRFPSKGRALETLEFFFGRKVAQRARGLLKDVADTGELPAPRARPFAHLSPPSCTPLSPTPHVPSRPDSHQTRRRSCLSVRACGGGRSAARAQRRAPRLPSVTTGLPAVTRALAQSRSARSWAASDGRTASHLARWWVVWRWACGVGWLAWFATARGRAAAGERRCWSRPGWCWQVPRRAGQADLSQPHGLYHARDATQRKNSLLSHQRIVSR